MPSRPPVHRPPVGQPRPRKRPEIQDRYYGSAAWKRLREQALQRDGHRCTAVDDGVRCIEPGVVVDHKHERRDGGADTIDNLRTLCRRHDARRHRDKAARS